MSIRAQSNGKFFQSYTASFTEPWLGGKRPTSLSVSGAYSKYANIYATNSYFAIFQGSVSLGKRLKWPDDNFIASTALEYQQYDINNYQFGSITNGKFNNINLSQTISRNSISDPLFPKSGSRLTLVLSASPPYSFFPAERVRRFRSRSSEIHSLSRTRRCSST